MEAMDLGNFVHCVIDDLDHIHESESAEIDFCRGEGGTAEGEGGRGDDGGALYDDTLLYEGG